MFSNKNFSSFLKLCSVLPALAIMPAVGDGISWNDIKDKLTSGNDATLTNNVTADSVINITGSPTLDLADKTITGWGGQGLYIGNEGSTFTIKGTDAESAILSGFTSTSQGGLLQSVKDTIVNIDKVSMNYNGVDDTTEKVHLGGALKISGEANITNSIFQGNTAKGIVGDSDYEGSAGAIYAATASKISIKNTKFLQNEADAVGAVGIFKEASLENVLFEKNKATSATGDGGGALFFGAVADATVTTVNSVNNSSFKENESASRGGAIATRTFADGNNSAAKLDITNAVFDSNIAATNGGAIDNYFYHSDTNADGVTVDNSTFTANQAANGGAIYNHIGLDGDKLVDDAKQIGSMYITNSLFTNNIATSTGGAIYNAGQMSLGGTFEENSASQKGGAIYNATNGKLTIVDGTTFKNNKTYSFAGAIFNAGELKIGKNVTFEGNKAQRAGAIYNYGDPDAKLTIGDNVIFKNNVNTFDDVTGKSGGAIITAAKTTIGDNALFDGNISNWGGAAIAIQANKDLPIRTDQNVIVEIGKNATFSNNKVLKGGQPSGNDGIVDMDEDIYKYGTASLTIGEGAEFSNNESVALAIRNNKSTATLNGAIFKDNHGYDVAGAIYNIGTTNLNGTIVFQNNKAGNVLNDIYNKGTLNISGDLTLDGGITGDGTINFTGDTNLVARLQDKAIINASEVIGLDKVTFKMSDLIVENGIDSVEYQLVKADTIDKQFAGIVAENVLYDFALGTQKGGVKITRKSVAEQTAGLEKAGLDSNAAKTIAAISAVKTTGNAVADALFADLTTAAQSGDTAAAETINEVAKVINPESEAVVQSAAVSTQNTINTLTAGRMDLGRNGGDLSLTSGGVWVQGLFNRAKSGDKFSANTRGISAGIDGTINNDIMLGIGYAYGHSDVSAKTRDTDIDNHSVFLYGQYKPTQWYANATLNYTTSGYKENGSVMGLLAINSDYRANAFGANVATGYELPFGLTPELGLRYLHVRTNDYTNSLGFHTDAKNTNFLTGIIGARYGFDIAASEALLVRPELSAAAKYDLVSNGNTATVALPGVDAYTLDVERLNRFGGEFGAGLTMSYYGFDLSLTYSIDVREDYTSQTGMAKFRYNF